MFGNARTYVNADPSKRFQRVPGALLIKLTRKGGIRIPLPR